MKHERRRPSPGHHLAWGPFGLGFHLNLKVTSWWRRRHLGSSGKGSGTGWALSWGGRPARDGALGWGPRSFEKVPEETVEGGRCKEYCCHDSPGQSQGRGAVRLTRWEPVSDFPLVGNDFLFHVCPCQAPNSQTRKAEEVTVSRRVAPFDSKAGAAATALPWVRRKLRQ